MSNEAVGDAQDVRFKVPVAMPPYSSIVRVDTSEGHGTGFLVDISSHYVILTAGHCLPKGGNEDVKIVWPEGHEDVIDKTMYHVDPIQDYGFLLVSEEVIPVKVRDQLSVPIPYSPNLETQHTVTLSGYPGTVYLNSNYAKDQFGIHLTISQPSQLGQFLCYIDPTSPGMSGGPVFYKCDKKNYIFGIHIRGFTTDGERQNFIAEANPQNECVRISLGDVKLTDKPIRECGDLNRYNVALLLTTPIIENIKRKIKEMSKNKRTSGITGRHSADFTAHSSVVRCIPHETAQYMKELAGYASWHTANHMKRYRHDAERDESTVRLYYKKFCRSGVFSKAFCHSYHEMAWAAAWSTAEERFGSMQKAATMKEKWLHCHQELIQSGEATAQLCNDLRDLCWFSAWFTANTRKGFLYRGDAADDKKKIEMYYQRITK